MRTRSWWKRHAPAAGESTGDVIVLPTECWSQEEWHRRNAELAELGKRSWQEHFAAHPEQLLPGAEAKRTLSREMYGLQARLIFNVGLQPDVGEDTEVIS